MSLDAIIQEQMTKEFEPGPLVVNSIEEEKYDVLVREELLLEESDLQILDATGPARSQSGIQHLRAIHHNIAMRLAAGDKPVAICATLRVTPQTITKLEKDAQFQSLIAHYREDVVQEVIDSHGMMSLVAQESLRALHERLIGEDRESIATETLRRIGETFVDRTGHSPVRRSESLSHHTHEVNSATVQRVKALHAEDNTYEAEVVEPSPTMPQIAAPKDPEDTISLASLFKPTQKAEAPADSTAGDNLREQSA